MTAEVAWLVRLLAGLSDRIAAVRPIDPEGKPMIGARCAVATPPGCDFSIDLHDSLGRMRTPIRVLKLLDVGPESLRVLDDRGWTFVVERATREELRWFRRRWRRFSDTSDTSEASVPGHVGRVSGNRPTT